jgi:DNA polymerase bacteriophage-type
MPTYPCVHRDYETRSEVDLKKVGAHVYAAHPTTKVILAVWIIEHSQGEYSAPIVWYGDIDDYEMSPDMPEEVYNLIENGARVCGHNAAFEDAIDTLHFDARGYLWRWAFPKLSQLDCTMARAAVQGLPLELEKLANAMEMPVRKDSTGHRLMLQMCRPRAPQAGEDRKGVYWNYDPVKVTRLTSYCVLDVKTEIGIDRVLRQLQDQERPVWELDQIMNNRGIMIDYSFCHDALNFIKHATLRANKRLKLVTGGAVEKVTQVERLKDFAKWRGVEFKETFKRRRSGEGYITESADKEGLLDLLEEEEDEEMDEPVGVVPGKSNAEWKEGDEPSVRAAFELRLDAGKSSLKKLDKFLAYSSVDGRARGTLQYHAASPGRWGGRGPQLQNLVRQGITEAEGGWDQAHRDMLELDDETFEMVWGSPFDVVSRMMRGVLIADSYKKLYFADYSNVEARGCVWAAGQWDMVKLFAEGGLIYEEMASHIFGFPVEEIVKLHKTKFNIIPRFVGKETVLGCGYGMGWAAFKRNCKKKGRIVLDDDLCQKGVETWREQNPKVVQLWYALGDAMRNAIESDGVPYYARSFAFRKVGKWLQMRLPSGRLLWYRRPHFRPSDEDLESYDAGQGVPRQKWKITYWGVNSTTKQWARETTWGGKILENGVQGLCRDFLAGAKLKLEAAGYPMVLSVHDEAIAEVPDGFGSIEEFVSIMTELPPWAKKFPLMAEGGEGYRYAKG